MKSMKTLLAWVIFLPAAYLGATLSYALCKWSINRLIFEMGFITEVSATWASGMAFVIAGGMLVKPQIKIASVLLWIAGITLSVIMYYAVNQPMSLSVIFSVSCTLTAFYTFSGIFDVNKIK